MLANRGLSVLLWDLDPQGGSSYFFNLQNKNDNSFARLFDRYIAIYDVIQHTDIYHIDVISNDSGFTDQFMNKASRLTTLSFVNHELVSGILDEVKDDYDVCILDCSPGRFLLHENIFHSSHLVLVPNIPAPLSVYCNNMLMDSLLEKMPASKKLFGFYNMVQAHKTLHKHYLESRNTDSQRMLYNYIPFYVEIESITLSRESIFHQLRSFKSNVYYDKLWSEICERMDWKALSNAKTIVVDIIENAQSDQHSDKHPLMEEMVALPIFPLGQTSANTANG
jgi:cellulose biosynthesis protein BcsQ